MKLFFRILASTLVFISHASFAQVTDSYTYANYDQVQVSHLYLDLSVDFDKKITKGFCRAFSKVE
jgi:hypothetical protein